MEVYHYRSIEVALKEISKGTFRFASKVELNDPIEGYLNLYFSGDRPAWEGLFKNYIRSLYDCLELFFCGIDEDKIFENVVASDVQCHEGATALEEYQAIMDEFIQNEMVKESIGYLMNEVADDRRRCSKHMLSLWLTLVQFTAYNICAKTLNRLYGNELLLIEEWDYDHFYDIVEAIKKLADETGNLKKASENMLEGIDESLVVGRISQYLKAHISDVETRRHDLWFEISSNFAYRYVSQLENLVYPGGWVVCFSKKNDNSVMWGNYADHHCGVCLVYDFAIKEGNVIELRHEKEQQNILAKAGEVRYTTETVERNFFESLWQFSSESIRAWMEGANGEVSDFYETYREPARIEEYRKPFTIKYYTKMPEWEYENEYRLLLEDYWFDKEERYFKYPKTALKGVIFGKETSLEDYTRVLKAVKYSDVDLENFQVYRAVYNEAQREIDIMYSEMLTHFLKCSDLL